VRTHCVARRVTARAQQTLPANRPHSRLSPRHADIAVQACGRRLQGQCAQNKPLPCAQNNKHVPSHLGGRVDELTETRKTASTCHSAVLCQLGVCTSAQGLPPSVGAAHTQTPQASGGTRAEGTGSARRQHAISTGPQSSTRLSPPSLSRPPTLRVLGCHLADRLGVINPPRTPPRRFPGGDATACGRCFFQPDAGVVFFQPEADVLVSAARGLPPHKPRRGPRAVPWSRCSLAHNHSVHPVVSSVRRPCLAR